MWIVGILREGVKDKFGLSVQGPCPSGRRVVGHSVGDQRVAGQVDCHQVVL